MLDALWKAATKYGIDGVVMVAQSLNETGKGHFGRLVKPEYFNPCGLKVRDLRPYIELFGTSEHAFAHMQFASWDAGYEAMAQHLNTYCGVPLPDWAILLDPRAVWVDMANPIQWVHELDRWAGRPGYGKDLERGYLALL